MKLLSIILNVPIPI